MHLPPVSGESVKRETLFFSGDLAAPLRGESTEEMSRAESLDSAHPTNISPLSLRSHPRELHTLNSVRFFRKKGSYSGFAALTKNDSWAKGSPASDRTTTFHLPVHTGRIFLFEYVLQRGDLTANVISVIFFSP